MGGEEEGGEEGGEEERSPSPTKMIGAMYELWVRLQISVKRMTSVQYTHMKEWALELLCGPGQGFQV